MSGILNIEFKAQISNLSLIKNKLVELGAKDFGIDHQVDYYFHTPKGRLKLRKGNIENSLIYYERSDAVGPRKSFIRLERLPPLNSLEKVLEAFLKLKLLMKRVILMS